MINWYGKPLILGSSSPRRAQLLKQIGLEFSIIPSHLDESRFFSISDPQKLALTIAIEKGKELVSRLGEGFIITADTLVVIDDMVLGKPDSREQACEMLNSLSGRTHQVYTGLAITNAENKKLIAEVERTAVTFKNLSNEEIEFYVDNYNPYDKAGSYGIQDFSAVFCARIEGCFYNVVGFPLFRFFEMSTKRLSQIL